jgi:hypothetical protein
LHLFFYGRQKSGPPKKVAEATSQPFPLLPPRSPRGRGAAAAAPINQQSEEAMTGTNTKEPTPFIEYWEAVDAAMMKFFGIDTSDAGIDADLIASAQEECQTPEDFARSYGTKYDLTYLDDWKILHGIPTALMSKIGKAKGGSI